MSIMTIIVIYCVAIIIAAVVVFKYRKWIKNHMTDTLSERPSNTGLPIKGGVENFKIVNRY